MSVRISLFSALFLLTLLSPYTRAGDKPAEPGSDTWIDRRHDSLKDRLSAWSHDIDGWFGETDPARPAGANLRLILDTEWNKNDRFTVSPRVRGRLKLPALEKKVHLIIGDDSLDDELQNEATAYRSRSNSNGKTLDIPQSRDNNASLAIRLSDAFKQDLLETDFDIGIRSGSDLYARAKAAKNWQLTDRTATRLEQIYRYGLKSKHHVRTNWETRYTPDEKSFFANQAYLQYERDKTDDWAWGNSLYRQHNLGRFRHANYGIYTGGSIEKRKAALDTYGPFATYRQPVWRDWLFAQAEVNYYNNRKEDQKHRVGTLLRLEALF